MKYFYRLFQSEAMQHSRRDKPSCHYAGDRMKPNGLGNRGEEEQWKQ